AAALSASALPSARRSAAPRRKRPRRRRGPRASRPPAPADRAAPGCRAVRPRRKRHPYRRGRSRAARAVAAEAGRWGSRHRALQWNPERPHGACDRARLPGALLFWWWLFRPAGTGGRLGIAVAIRERSMFVLPPNRLDEAATP